MFTKPKSEHQDEVVKEYPAAGKYRIRVLKINGATALDIREYVDGGSFQGFTRRGVRLTSAAELELLRGVLGDAAGLMKVK
jgi:hypothetical protein